MTAPKMVGFNWSRTNVDTKGRKWVPFSPLIRPLRLCGAEIQTMEVYIA